MGRLIEATGRNVLSAAASDRPALEGYKGHGVFTYTLLDALARADRDGNGLIEVTELAGHIDRVLPEITQRVFGIRQLPQKNLQGLDFALAKKTDTGVEAAPVEAGGVADTPTHVVLEAVTVFREAGGGAPISELAPLTTFTVIRMENGWVAIARDGKQIGFVEAARVKRLR